MQYIVFKVPDGFPNNLTGQPQSTSEILFAWQPIPPRKRNGIIIAYTLTLRNTETDLEQSILLNGSTLNHTVSGLDAWTNYTVRICGITEKGPGPWSSETSVTTLEQGKQISVTRSSS